MYKASCIIICSFEGVTFKMELILVCCSIIKKKLVLFKIFFFGFTMMHNV